MPLSCFYHVLIKIWAPTASWEINEHSYCYWNQHKGILYSACSYLNKWSHGHHPLFHQFSESNVFRSAPTQTQTVQSNWQWSNPAQPCSPHRAGRCGASTLVYTTVFCDVCSTRKNDMGVISSCVKLVSNAGWWWMINSSSMTGLLTPSHICSYSH